MNIGMLWFDNDPRAALDAKVQRAADYYRTKYGRKPTLCFVHPSMLPTPPESAAPVEPAEAAGLVAAGVEVRSNRSVMPNHFWIGVNS
ncbi:MAG: hypothetical protein ACKOC5_13705 [Chloroflexota bacterium]